MYYCYIILYYIIFYINNNLCKDFNNLSGDIIIGPSGN